jgi:hypothetical protein
MFVFQNRRERISERLKILQELVPNGSKVDFSNYSSKLSCFFCTSLTVKINILSRLELLYPRQNLYKFLLIRIMFNFDTEFCRLIWLPCWKKQLVMWSFFSYKSRWETRAHTLILILFWIRIPSGLRFPEFI